MAIRAVAFDIGGVLEKVDDLDGWLRQWVDRLGLEQASIETRLGRIDPRQMMGTGEMSEAEFRDGCREAFGFSETDVDEFMAAMWDWYCGELDTELVAFAGELRPAYRTGIISNSADGARREEQGRYGFEQLVDDIVYSHEVGLAKPDPRIYRLACERLGVAPEELVFIDDTPRCVDSANALGIHAVLHSSTPETIRAVTALLA